MPVGWWGRIGNAYSALCGRQPVQIEPSKDTALYARVFESNSNANEWFNPSPNVDKIAKNLFGLRSEEYSTYKCSCLAEELEAVTAFELLHDSSNTRKLYLLRISVNDIERAGMILDEDGDFNPTGVHSVDHRHANIIGTFASVKDLVGELISSHEGGRDIIRRFWDRQMIAQMRRFIAEDEIKITQAAKERCLLKVSVVN